MTVVLLPLAQHCLNGMIALPSHVLGIKKVWLVSKVVPIKLCANAPDTLRMIAEQMENGKFATTSVTVIAGAEIFQCGEFDDERAVENAVFNMTMGLHKLMRPIFEE